LAVALLGTGLMAACSPTEPLWAAPAEEFFAAFHEAQRTGLSNTAPFYAPDVSVDMRGCLGVPETTQGRAAWLTAMRDSWMVDLQVPDTFVADEPVYLSLGGAVDPVRLFGDSEEQFSTAYVYTLSGSGITTQSWQGSVRLGDIYNVLNPAPFTGWVDGYVGAWSSGEPGAVGALYAEGAVVRDTIAGLRLEGTAAIGAAASGPASGGALPGAVLHTIPEDGGPAAYATGNPLIDRRVLLLTVDDGGGCPGEMAVVLWLDDEDRVVREERYHRVDALRRCTDPDALPVGWWDAVTVPGPPQIRQTGTLAGGSPERASPRIVWNGTPDLERLVTWAQQRFADAVLPVPFPDYVTFLPPGADAATRYGFTAVGDTMDVALEYTEAQACPDGDCAQVPTWVKAATLHQLARVWFAENLREWDETTFARERGLVWSDETRPPAEQAAWLAAETVAWGLMDEPYVVDARLGAPSCQALAADFQELTGAFPDPRSCAGSTDGQP
jgi:hypothetical protein